MVTVLKRGSDKATMQEVLKKVSSYEPKRGLDSLKYSGKVKFKEDGLRLQKQWRDEWE
jgi:hypothetical protein